ncbi:MAG: hypothetical protein A2Z46_01865 [Nitrospirae bacterium RBG_19FT_COMBO_55_12]|nr:MAG: hypothetical protein A2Z46_01865 [Nitrospirae bacterium RBG_19FT_COMBO_55_12]
MTVKVLIAIVISAALFIMPACKPGETPPAVVGNKAPSFTLRDLEGKKIGLSDFSGKVVIMDFWATWCSPCKESTREFERLHRRYKNRGIVFLGISMDLGGSAAQKVKDFSERNDLTYLMLMDDGAASKAYAVHNIPATYVLDKNHVIVKIYPGYMPGLGSMISEQIEKLSSNADTFAQNDQGHKPQQHRHEKHAKQNNPIPMTEHSVTQGESLYEKHCQPCHGGSGNGGIGPNLTDTIWIHGNTDGEIFKIITDGAQGTAMRGFEKELTKEMRWHLVNYLKSLERSRL